MAEQLLMLYEALRGHCASKPGALELRRRRETLFTAGGKVFAFMNSPRHPAVTVKTARAERGRLLAHRAIRRARWVGWLGWVTVAVDDEETLELAIGLIDRSYEVSTLTRSR